MAHRRSDSEYESSDGDAEKRSRSRSPPKSASSSAAKTSGAKKPSAGPANEAGACDTRGRDRDRDRPRKATAPPQVALQSASEMLPGTAVQVHSSEDGLETYVEISDKRRVTARSFKRQTYIDIREYYTPKEGGSGSEMKPGSKGISLTLEQWEMLKAATPAIDSAIVRLQRR